MIRRREVKRDVFHSARKLGGVVPQAGSLLVGITAIAYFAGWRNVTKYYDTLGASWALSSLPSVTFLSVSAGLIISILATTFFFLILAKDHKISALLLAVIVVVLVFAATVVSRVPKHLPTGWVSEQTIWQCVQWGTGLLAAAAGVIFAQLSVQLSHAGNKWSSPMALSLYSALMLGLYGVPAQVGEARAEHDLNVVLTSLPLVEISKAPPTVGNEWRLVELIGSNALLVRLSDKPAAHTFRLVETKELTSIGYKKRDEPLM